MPFPPDPKSNDTTNSSKETPAKDASGAGHNVSHPPPQNLYEATISRTKTVSASFIPASGSTAKERREGVSGRSGEGVSKEYEDWFFLVGYVLVVEGIEGARGGGGR